MTLLDELERQRQEIAHLRAQYSAMKDRIERIASGLTRRRYPAETPRGENGRAVLPCVSCHRVGEVRGRGLCGSCYSRWRRSQQRQRS